MKFGKALIATACIENAISIQIKEFLEVPAACEKLVDELMKMDSSDAGYNIANKKMDWCILYQERHD